MSAGHVIETPVVEHLTFQVWDGTAGTPAQLYRWTGAQNASCSTLTAGGKVLRTNLATDPKVIRPAAHAANGFKVSADSFETWQGHDVIRWERTAAGAAGIYLQRNELATVPSGSPIRVRVAVFTETQGAHKFRIAFDGATTDTLARTVNLPSWSWQTVELTGTAPATGSPVRVGLDIVTALGEVGKGIYTSGLLIETALQGDAFDGDDQDVPATRGEWRDLADKATSIAIRRGAQQKGAGLETQVGTLDADLYGALDLSRMSDLRPNSPLRVIRPPAEPAVVWELQPRGMADTMASQAFSTRSTKVTENGVETTKGSVSYPSDGYLGYTGSVAPNTTTTIDAGAILIATPNVSPFVPVPTNPKPVGKFDAGEAYTLRANVRSTDETAVRPVKWVLFSGDSISPTVIAESKPWTPTRNYNADPSEWVFVAPADDGWQLGLATAADLTLTDKNTGTVTWTYAVSIQDARIWDQGRQRPEFTGTISDLYQSVELDKSTNQKHTFTTVQAVDAVQSLANTDRYGVIASSGAGYQTWADRIDQLAESSHVPIDAPVETNTVIYTQGKDYADGWLQQGTMTPSRDWYYGGTGRGGYAVYTSHMEGTAPSTRGVLSATIVAQRFSVFEQGAGYAGVLSIVPESTNGKVTALGTWAIGYRESNGTMTWGPAVDMKAGVQTLTVQFQPKSSSGVVGVFQRSNATLDPGQRFAFAIRDMQVMKVGSPDAYALQDVAYESTLLNHFDLACNSVGARWYVTKRGAVLFRRAEEDTEPGARFSDTAAGDVSYTDIALSYDTRNVVNSLKLNQHGYDPATGNAADSSQTYTDDDSIRTWGARAAELDTCLYLGSPHQNDAVQRSRELMAGLRQPTYSIQSFTFNAQSDPTVLDAVELRDTVAIDYENIRQRSRVLAIEHAITPTRWMVTVTVNESHVGPRFRDVDNAGYATFAELNAALAGKTFGDVNAMPFDPQETP